MVSKPVAFALAALLAGCATENAQTYSLRCDTFDLPTGFVLVTSVSHRSMDGLPSIGGYFLKKLTFCADGKSGIAPTQDAIVFIRGASGDRVVEVQRSGTFYVEEAALTDTLIFIEGNAKLFTEGKVKPGLGYVPNGAVYVITVSEAIESYVRDREARVKAF